MKRETVKTAMKIISALSELEAKGCHSVFFEYGDNLFRIRIFRGNAGAGNIVFEQTATLEPVELDKLLAFIENMKNHVWTTTFQCYKREFVEGVKCGEWEKTKSRFELGENATYAALIDGSGYFIDDPENNLQYFANMNELCETFKNQ
jgi:hypothetical protein